MIFLSVCMFVYMFGGGGGMLLREPLRVIGNLVSFLGRKAWEVAEMCTQHNPSIAARAKYGERVLGRASYVTWTLLPPFHLYKFQVEAAWSSPPC